jgi:methylated-DNA-[protein]-cysteine S-methyltransferase
MTLKQARYVSPLGSLSIALGPKGLRSLEFDERKRAPGTPRPTVPARQTASDKDLAAVFACLDRYFGGDAGALDALPVDPVGTPFQRRVWAELRKIPAGETRSYADIASAIGQAGASRAVGTANGKNPVALVIPCHRVVRTGGYLGGYGGGLDRKAWLLTHERVKGQIYLGLGK